MSDGRIRKTVTSNQPTIRYMVTEAPTGHHPTPGRGCRTIGAAWTCCRSWCTWDYCLSRLGHRTAAGPAWSPDRILGRNCDPGPQQEGLQADRDGTRFGSAIFVEPQVIWPLDAAGRSSQRYTDLEWPFSFSFSLL